MKYRALFLACLVSFTCILSAETSGSTASPWSITVSPSLFVPLVSDTFSANELFSPSWGGNLAAEYDLRKNVPVSLRLSAGYTIGGLKDVENIPVEGSLSEATLLGGALFSRSLSPVLTFRTFADAGVSFGSLTGGSSAAYAAAQTGAGLSFKINKTLSARFDAAFLYKAGLAGGLGATLGAGYALPVRSALRNAPTKPRLLELFSLEVASVFPSLRSRYDESPLGSISITNTGKETATDVRVSFLIKQYMDAPKECAVLDSIEPGKTVEIPLLALFNDSILGITEATKVTGEVSVEYGGDMKQTKSATVVVYDRNALTWSDDRKAAAFVSSKDPWVLDLAGNIMASVMSARNPELSKNFQTAIAMHEGLKVYGIGYMLSPNRPFAKAVLDPEVVDSLKYPRQTLGYRAGDCADLSVLYASCFEAAGIPTAFVTIPGHIFMAIDMNLSVDQARARAMNLNEYIVHENRLWLPIETTMRDDSFAEVTRKAALEWRDASSAKTAAFYPIHDAWDLYPPVGLPADGSTIALPAGSEVARFFKADLDPAVKAELGARLAALPSAASGGQSAVKAANDRGVLYGKYGFYPEAVKYFEEAAKDGNASALINLGNIAILRSDPASAYAFYQEAAKKLPQNAKLLVNLAKASSALGKTDEAAKTLKEVRKLDPKLADQYAWLSQGSTGSARAAGVEDAVLWF